MIDEVLKQEIRELPNKLSNEEIIKLVTELGSDDYKETANEIIFKTICHNVDAATASMKLYYYKKNKRFHCYTDCDEPTFDIYGLFKRRYELLGIQYSFYQDIYLKIAGANRSFNDSSFFKPYYSNFQKYNTQINIDIKPIKESLLNIYIQIPIPNWLEEGISKEAMELFNIRYSISENRIIIPHYNTNNELIGIRARALEADDIAKGKYRPVSIEGKTYSHPLGYNLYGYNIVKDTIKRKKIAIIAEGEKSCLLSYSMFGNNSICVAACGSNVSNYQIDLLCAGGADKILIAFDKEGKDWKEQEKIYKKREQICKRFSNKVKMGFIWDNQNLLNLKDSPFDKGEEVFNQLYKGAVWI